MISLLKNCGFFGFLTLLVAGMALAASTGALVTALAKKAKVAGLLAALGLLLAGAVGLTGFTGTLLGRKAVQAAMATPGLTETDRAHIQQAGFTDARDCSRIGISAAALPFLLGAVAASVALFTKKKDETEEGPSVPLVLVGAACAFTGLLASGGLGTARVAGSDYAPHVWSLMAASEKVLASTGPERTEGCRELETALLPPEGSLACGMRREFNLQAVGDLVPAGQACVRDGIAAVGALPKADERKRKAREISCSATYASLTESAKRDLGPQLESFMKN